MKRILFFHGRGSSANGPANPGRAHKQPKDAKRRRRYAAEAAALSRPETSTFNIIMILGLVIIATAMRLHGLAWLFDFDGYDEGVYWQTLRAMHQGFGLYHQIFYSQPPLFLVSIYPFNAILGHSIVAARAGVAALSLLGLLCAYMMGNALASRAGALAAMALIVFSPLYLALSQLLEAEGPATAFLLLSVGAALMWSERSLNNETGTALAILSGAALSVGILIKLSNVTAIVPILLLVGWRILASGKSSGKTPPVLAPFLFGVITAILTALIFLVPYLKSTNSMIDQVVRFHLAARNVWQTNNAHILSGFFISNVAVSIAAMVSSVFAAVRRDWRVIPLTAWLAATIGLLLLHAPLFQRLTVCLIPPLIALAVLGLKHLPAVKQIKAIASNRISLIQASALLMGLATFAVIAQAMPSFYAYYHARSERGRSNGVRLTAEVAAELQRLTRPDQWIVTDGQFIAALADRDTPPSLVDTSAVRIRTGYLSTQKLIEAALNPRVHAVMFATNRLVLRPVADFHEWVAQHFVAPYSFGSGIELWVR